MDKLSANVFFSGVGMQERGIEQSKLFDFEVINTSEIDKDAVVSYATIHCGLTKGMIENYDEYPSRQEMAQHLSNIRLGYDFIKQKEYDWNKKIRSKSKDLEKYWLACKLSNNLGDVSKIEKVEYADMWTFSFPCFVEGTLVLTGNGYKPIEEVTENDLVLTHNNRYKKVVKPMINHADHIYKFETMISEALYVTEEHPFYVRKKTYKRDNKGNRLRIFKDPEWVKVKDLSRDYYVGTAINQKSELPNWNGIEIQYVDGRKRHLNKLNDFFDKEDFWYVIGRYIGDGWIRTQSGIIICGNEEELGQVIERLERLGFGHTISKERTCTKIHISFKEIGAYCEQFGRGAANKRITSDILNLPVKLLKAFLEGYISADGSYTQGRYKISSVSRELIYGVGQCIAKAYNRPFSVYFTQRAKTCMIEGRVVNQRDSYSVVFKLDKDPQDKAFYEDGYIWSPIRNNQKMEYNGLVYNLEVEDDNSYVVQNIIVHNCTDLSAAGKQKGLENTRSGLLKEIDRLLQVSKEDNTLPKFFILENVKPLIGTKFKPYFDEWINYINNIGFNVYYDVLNSKDFGVPQTRERVFAIGIRKDIDTKKFKFPCGFDNGIRLKDILDTNIDEKYYLKLLKDFFVKHSIDSEKQGNGFRFKPHNPSSAQIAFTITTHAGSRMDDNFVNDVNLGDDSYFEFTEKNLDDTFKAKRLAGLFDELIQDEDGEHLITHQAGSIWNKECLSPTLDTMAGGWRHPMILEKFLKLYRVRRLTPRECFALMGMEKSDCDKCKKIGVSDTQLYKQAGNGLVTSCIENIIKELYKAQFNN